MSGAARRKRRALRPAPPSERKQEATQSLKVKKRRSTDGLPKVIIGAASRPLRDYAAATRRARADDPMKATIADGPEAKRAREIAQELVAEGAIEPAPETEPIGPEPPAAEPSPEAPEPAESSPEVPEPSEPSPPPPDEAEDGLVEIVEVVIDEETDEPPPPKPKKRPADMTVADHIELGDEHTAEGLIDEGLKEFKKALGKLGTAPTPERGAIYVRIGRLMREQGNVRLAVSNFDKALSIDPTHAGALEALIELNAKEKNWRAVFSAEERYLASDLDEEIRLQLLLASGERWRLDGGDVKRARERLVQARDAFPQRVEPLQRLVALYEQEGAIDQVIDAHQRIAELTTDPRGRAMRYCEIGEYCMFEAHREREGLEAYEKALLADPTHLEALEIVATVLAEGQEWGELERVYRQIIAAFEEGDTDERSQTVVAELHRRLALLYRDHLEDSESAFDELELELAIRPDQVSAQLLAADIALELDHREEAFRHLRAAAHLDPERSETFHQLFDLAQKDDDLDAAFLAASVAMMIGAASKREFVLFRANRIEGVPSHRRPMRRDAWGWLRDSRRDQTVDEVMRALAPPVLRMRVAQLEAEDRLPDLPESARQNPDTSTVSAVRTLAWGCQFLGMVPPAIYLSDDLPGGLSAPITKRQTTIIGREVLSGMTMVQLTFLVGQHMAMRLPEYSLVGHLRSIDELTICFLAALHIVLGTSPASEAHARAVEALSVAMVKHQRPEERRALEAAVGHFEESGGRVNLKHWLAAVERCATRTGYLLCGDLEAAAEVVRNAGDYPWIRAEELVADLLGFAVSEDNAKLRREIGTSIGSEDEIPRHPTLPPPPSWHGASSGDGDEADEADAPPGDEPMDGESPDEGEQDSAPQTVKMTGD